MIEQALVEILEANAAVSALVGTRIWPLQLPEEPTLPAVVYQRISGPRERSHQGPSGFATPRFQLNCWATTYLGAKNLAAVVRQALDGYTGTIAGEDVQGGFVEDDRDDFDTTRGLERVIVEVVLHHGEV